MGAAGSELHPARHRTRSPARTPLTIPWRRCGGSGGDPINALEAHPNTPLGLHRIAPILGSWAKSHLALIARSALYERRSRAARAPVGLGGPSSPGRSDGPAPAPASRPRPVGDEPGGSPVQSWRPSVEAPSAPAVRRRLRPRRTPWSSRGSSRAERQAAQALAATTVLKPSAVRVRLVGSGCF
jgi:hypothetical protein